MVVPQPHQIQPKNLNGMIRVCVKAAVVLTSWIKIISWVFLQMMLIFVKGHVQKETTINFRLTRIIAANMTHPNRSASYMKIVKQPPVQIAILISNQSIHNQHKCNVWATYHPYLLLMTSKNTVLTFLSLRIITSFTDPPKNSFRKRQVPQQKSEIAVCNHRNLEHKFTRMELFR